MTTPLFTADFSTSTAKRSALLTPEETRKPKCKRLRPKYPTETQRKIARERFEAGVGYMRIADELGLSVYTVQSWQKAFRQGRFRVRISRNQYRYLEETKRAVIAKRLGGASWREIGQETGVPLSTCRFWMRKFEEAQAASAAKSLR